MFKKRNSLVGSKDDREPIKQVDESNNLSFLNMPSVSNWNLRPVLYLSVFLLFGVVIWSQGKLRKMIHVTDKTVIPFFITFS